MPLNLYKDECNAECEQGMHIPLYQPSGPSVLSVFHRQSIGFLYSIPTCLPSGMTFVGWLYIRVRA